VSPRLTTPQTLRAPALDGLKQVIEAEPAQFFGVLATRADALLPHQEVAVDLARPRTSGGCWPWPMSGRSRQTCAGLAMAASFALREIA
jgi:hypothetical protein